MRERCAADAVLTAEVWDLYYRLNLLEGRHSLVVDEP
jgi:hypothetical protein